MSTGYFRAKIGDRSGLGPYCLLQDLGKAGQKNKGKFISMLKIGHALVISAGLLWLIHYDINMSFSKTEKNDINFEMQILQTEE